MLGSIQVHYEGVFRTEKRILVINPGSTSTKIACFLDEKCMVQRSVPFDTAPYRDSLRVFDQLDARLKTVREFLSTEEIPLERLDMIVARGGPTPRIRTGAYRVNQLMLDLLEYMPASQHASALGVHMASLLAKPHKIPVIIYDAPVADEGEELVHITGLPEVSRNIWCHVLNTRMMARKLGGSLGKSYETMNLVVAHLGGGISVAAHRRGVIIDSLLSDEGPMAPTRCGRLPVNGLIKLCYSGKYTQEQLQMRIRNHAGLAAWFGTSDALVVENLALDGDPTACKVYEAMAYQTAKCIGEMAVALEGEVDAILLTGALARSEMLIQWIEKRVSFLAKVYCLPGEEEMSALALGALRVLNGEEEAREFESLPEQYADKVAVYAEIKRLKQRMSK